MENQPIVPNYEEARKQAVVSVGDWILTFILMAIPVVNLIMLFVWGFGGSAPLSKANWAKATLILYLVMLVLVILFWGVIGTAIMGMRGY